MSLPWDWTRLTYRGARILALLAIAGRNRAWLRRTTGLGVHTIERLLVSADQTPSPRTLHAVAETLGVFAAWLDPDGARRELTPAETDEMEKCARLLHAIALGKRIDARKFPNARAEGGGAYRVIGDSLAGAGVLDGDLAHVRSIGNVRAVVGSLVVVRLNGKLYLKRLLVGPGGVVLLLSAADGYEPIAIRRIDAFALLGEVVGATREYSQG